MSNIIDRVFIGIDVQLARDCACAIMDAGGHVIETGWMDPDALSRAGADLGARHGGATVGIDAPRMPLPAPRQHYWTGDSWRHRRPSDKGFGRHCEVVISACGLARPQWTPTRESTPDWMEAGFELFRCLAGAGLETEEVFPSASYRMLVDDPEARISMPLNGFLPGPKDMLDAVVAAFTIREFVQGRGCAVGGGDRLGTIVLPRNIEHPKAGLVGAWPGA